MDLKSANLVTSGDMIKVLGVSGAKVKKAIQQLRIEPKAKRGVCNYYSRDDLAKVKKLLGK